MKHVSKILLLLSFLGLSLASFGQAEQPCEGDDPFDCPEIPIDGGASLILLAGASAGVFKMIKSRKENA